MKDSKKISPLQITGLVLMLAGVINIFVPNEAWYHDVLQLTYVLGAILYVTPILRKKWLSSKEN